jgi:hypothetical protein
MKRLTLCIVAFLCLVLAGQACAQGTADSYRKAGAAYFKAGQFRESVKAYQQVIRLKPDDADAYQHLGEAYGRLNMNKEAAEAYEKSADLNEKEADRLITGKGATAPSPAPAVTPAAQTTTAQAKPQPAAGIALLKYKVGDRVEYVYDGKWFKAIIIDVRDDSANQLYGKMYAPYRVHPLGYNGVTDTWACCVDFADHRSQLRAPGSGPTEPVPGGEANDEVLKAMSGVKAARPSQPAAKEYTCEVGNPIIITGNGTYNGGTFGFNPATSILTFHGGVYDGQRAVYEVSYGLAQLHILGPSGRPVIDCD